MAYQIPYTFIPGTKAKANEVNSNFSKIIEYLTELNDSVLESNTDLSILEENLTQKMDDLKNPHTRFCVNSSSASVMSYNGNIIYFSSQFIATDIDGKSYTFKDTPSYNTQNLSNASYNVYISSDGEIEVLSNKIYRQSDEPAGKNIGDIWLAIGLEPLEALKWDGAEWTKFQKIPLGSFTKEAEGITALTPAPLNQNGYNLNTNSVLTLSSLSSEAKKVISSNSSINYASRIGRAWETLYQAESDGFLFVFASLDHGHCHVLLGPTAASVGTIEVPMANTCSMFLYSIFIPVSKGYFYKISKVSGNVSNQATLFFPTKGGI